MNELSLFTGAGGGILGTYLLGFRPIGYVEWDRYCQRILAQRIKDGILHEAPIFCDIRAFIGEGYAASYTGMVDVLTAGFPCQPFSLAGKRKGVDDERNMWPSTADIIRIVRPRRILLENVPGIREYLPVVIRDLRRFGYSVRRPLILGADDCGAKHRRKRIWIMADTESGEDHGRERRNVDEAIQRGQGVYSSLDFDGEDVSNSISDRLQGRWENRKVAGLAGLCSRTGGYEVKNMANTLSDGRPKRRQDDSEHDRAKPNPDGKYLPYAFLHGSHRTEGHEAEQGGNRENNRLPLRNRQWPIEPDVGRVAHGVASRVDRLKAIGNGQVPRVVATAWELLLTS